MTREKPAVDNEPSEVDVKVDAALGDLVRCAYHDRWLVDVKVDAALGDLVRCAYHDRWLRARLQIVEDHINDLRCENAQLRGDLGAWKHVD